MLSLGRRAIQAALEVADGFRNVLTGVGTSRSKNSGATYDREELLTFDELETLWSDNDLAATIVGKKVEDALRAGFEIECHDSNPDDDRDEVKLVMDEWARLGCTDLVSKAATFGRLKGAAGVILGVTGAGPLASPLDDTKITGIDRLYSFDAQDMTAASWYPNGQVETYYWNPVPVFGGSVPAAVIIHETRCLMFPGELTTDRGKQYNRGWDHSVLQRVKNALTSFDGMFSSTDAMFSDASQAIFKLQGLVQSLAENGGEGAASVQTRLMLMDLMRSSARAVFLDAGDDQGKGAEEFEYVDRTSFGQLDGVMNIYLIRLAAAARMPLTVLLGMAPAGMDATGESDMILWYNSVDVFRQKVLTQRILRLLRIVARTQGVLETEGWGICWPELARPKPLDVKTGEKMNVDAVVALVTAQIITQEEAAINMKRIAPTLGLTLDLDPRKTALKAAYTEIAAREMTGPAADPPPDQGNATKSTERKTPAKAAKKQV